MAIPVALQHRTQYRYGRAVALGPHTIRLRPLPQCRTPILSYQLQIEPANHVQRWHFDELGNHVARVLFPDRSTVLMTTVELVADLTPINPFAFVLEAGYELFPFRYSADLAHNLDPFRQMPAEGPYFESFVRDIPLQPQPTVQFLANLNERICNAIAYTTRMEHGVQSCEETLQGGSGSCRDSAWLLVQVCRRLGLAARFVSGYLIQLASDDAAEPGLDGPKQDSVDLHAWAEVFLPGAGWVGLDATSGLFTAEGHIALAAAPEPARTAPVSGTVEPAESEFTFSMTVRRLDAPPSIEHPYSDAEWQQVQSLAHAVDRTLAEQDVRLTMGGEPTYVGVDEAESLQWNFAALGPLKRKLGLELIWALRERTAPGGLLHLGQGKWYPGEALPRWAFQCISRMDSVPVWQDVDLFAKEEVRYAFADADALHFAQALCRRLQVSEGNLLPAFDTAAEDAAAEPTGYVLPLRRRQAHGGELRWSSQLWFDRPAHLELSPGDSPIGFRIPVETLPWVAPDPLRYLLEDGTMGEASTGAAVQLPRAPQRRPELFAQVPAEDPLPAKPQDAEGAAILIRPSLCVQVRDGRMHVFLPFVPVLADFLDLASAVEDTSAHLGIPVWLEGYAPPSDQRLRNFGLTPDPGVLEVNLPPTQTWDDLEQLNTVLAEEAAKHRLIAGKFAYDGTHQATGGGSHITVGGPTLLESPVLRRPDLLRSMLAFWQRHPSLSYLFAGMYVGPTSQYPRVDEARTDALYELELAFSHLPEDDCPPHILDGLFRNLLVDVSGNTHRSEFCIDKLYPPEGTGTRLGLLELRAFEMAPHVRMNLLQMLLVRALVSAFWAKPFDSNLHRWGAELHDRFMLPHFVQSDFQQVLAHLAAEGFSFHAEWFAPHVEFRFPKIGSVTADDVVLEVRQALEPWNVLAEETTSGGTGRSVDSSLERLQVKLLGATDSDRYLVSCNHRRVPLHPTGAPGEFIAGIRYRARRLNAALHPTIPVHTPLHFSLIDLRSGIAVARCTYHAGPPDGTVHTTRPADAAEARRRRRERFVDEGASSAPVELPPAERNATFPMTLDLRWPAPAGSGAGAIEGQIS